jgi:hypothetical protein
MLLWVRSSGMFRRPCSGDPTIEISVLWAIVIKHCRLAGYCERARARARTRAKWWLMLFLLRGHFWLVAVDLPLCVHRALP